MSFSFVNIRFHCVTSCMAYSALTLVTLGHCRSLFDLNRFETEQNSLTLPSTSTPPAQLKPHPPSQDIIGRSSTQFLFLLLFWPPPFEAPPHAQVISLLPRLVQDVQAAHPASHPRPAGRCEPTVWKLHPAGGLAHRGEPQLPDGS